MTTTEFTTVHVKRVITFEYEMPRDSYKGMSRDDVKRFESKVPLDVYDVDDIKRDVCTVTFS